MPNGWKKPLSSILLTVLLLAACGESDPTGESRGGKSAGLVVDYPLDESVFPPDFTPPTFLWHDDSPNVDLWRIDIEFSDGSQALSVSTDGPPLAKGEIDPDAIGPTNSLYEGTPYQQSAHSFPVPEDLWAEIQSRTVESPATVRISGVAVGDPATSLSGAAIRLTTSRDPVGAPIFYRDVPLMAGVGKNGVIAPLDPKALPRIKWRLRDLSKPRSKVLLTGLPVCANCHSFSQDGSTLGMDVDGPTGDKGAYAMTPLKRETVVAHEDVITWNSFEDKPEGSRTIGFLSRVSPDGKIAISTVNEALYVNNFTDYKFLQVFYPTRGILAWTAKESGEIKALPGADDPEYVHCNAVWFPDGKNLIFLRAKAMDPYAEGHEGAKFAGDPNETPIKFDLYRMPFNDGKGGTPEPLEGASENGMSNTFPKISPDGKWVVFTQCANGLLMRPDGRLWIVPAEGGTAREMRCNTPLMNSWHSFSPNGRWLVFSSKSNTPYTQLFLTHIDEDGNDTPAILIPHSTASNRASNIPEFVNRAYPDFNTIDMPAVDHHRHHEEGQALAKEGRYEEAAACFERALEKEHDFVRASAELGRALLEMNRLDEARARLNQTLEMDPDSAMVYVNLGILSIREGDPAKAISLLEKAIELEPGYHMAYFNLGVLLQDLGRLKEALPYFKTAARLEPSDTDGRNGLGWVLQLLGQWDAAILEYRAALEYDPSHLDARVNLLNALQALGRHEEKQAALKLLVASNPLDSALRLNLAWDLATHANAALRNGARAVKLAEACRKNPGELPEILILDVLAAAYAEAGRFQEAVKTGERALALEKAGQVSPLQGLDSRVGLYRKGQAFRQ
jgi:tetratricopeptide (TPR) repeat protein